MVPYFIPLQVIMYAILSFICKYTKQLWYKFELSRHAVQNKGDLERVIKNKTSNSLYSGRYEGGNKIDLILILDYARTGGMPRMW